MPALGDALIKAMEDSRRDLDALVRRAAAGEPEIAEADADEAPAPPSEPAANAGRSEPVSEEEKEFLIVSVVEDDAPAPADSAPPELPKTQALPAVEEPAPPPQEPPAAEPAASELPKTKELPGAQELPKTQALPAVDEPPAAPAQAPAAEPRLPEPVADEPVVPFAPSGVVRRHVHGSAGRPVLGSSVGSRPLSEELAGSRRVKSLQGADDYRIPALVRGVGGAVSLILAGKAGQPALVAFCGAMAGAGTTTVAVAVALQLAAQPHLRVLLVDADFRSPALARLLGPVSPEASFAAVLAGSCALKAALVWSEAENVAVLPLAGPAGSPQELFGFGRALEGPPLGRVLDECREIFDAVLFDAGSVPGWSGAASVAAAAGTAVLVVRAGGTGAREARESRRTLERCGARVAGAILTCAGAAGRG